jgi:hypothetical protein
MALPTTVTPRPYWSASDADVAKFQEDGYLIVPDMYRCDFALTFLLTFLLTFCSLFCSLSVHFRLDFLLTFHSSFC